MSTAARTPPPPLLLLLLLAGRCLHTPLCHPT